MKVFEIWTEGTQGGLELELLYPNVAENPDGITTNPDRAVDRRTQSFATVNVPEGGIVPVQKTGIVLKTWDRRNGLLGSIIEPSVLISYAAAGFQINQIRWEYNSGEGWFPLDGSGWETPKDDRYLKVFSLPVPYTQAAALEIRLRTNSGDSGETAKVYVFGAWIEGAHRAAVEFFSPTSFDDFGGATQNGGNALDQDLATYATASFDATETKNLLLLVWSLPQVRSSSFVKSTLKFAYSASGFIGNFLKIEYSTNGGGSWTVVYSAVPTNVPPTSPITLSFDVADPPQGMENVRVRVGVVGGGMGGSCTLRIHEVWLDGQFVGWDRQIGVLPPADFRYQIEPVRNVHLFWENYVMTLWDAEIDIGRVEIYRSTQGWILEPWGSTPVYNSTTAPSKHEFIDLNVPAGTYYYTIFGVDRNGQYSEAVEYAKPTSKFAYDNGLPEFPRGPIQVV